MPAKTDFDLQNNVDAQHRRDDGRVGEQFYGRANEYRVACLFEMCCVLK